ncbi:MAG: restriction endonuclease subunit S [Candidatus Bipolaricaulia bacterium]
MRNDLPPGDLPEGWTWRRLGSICEFQKGTKPRVIYEDPRENCLPYILIESFDGIYKKFTDDETCPQCEQDDILMVWDGARAGLCAIGLEGYIGSTLCALRPKPIIDPHFLYRFLSFHYEDLNRNVRGVGIPHLKRDSLESLPVPVPPLLEQRLIVVRVEALLDRVRSVTEKLENVSQTMMKRFREAILKQAFSGALTAEWRENQHRPNGWAQMKLGQLVELSNERVNPKELPDEPYIGLAHIEPHTTKIKAPGRAAEVSSTKTRFRKGDILYGKLRPYLNKVCIPDFDGICSTDILVFSCGPGMVNRYLLRLLTTRKFVAYAHQHMSGVQHPRVSFDQLARFPVPLPPVPEQQEIVDRVEELFNFADTVEQRVEEAKSRVEQLTQSVLARAFRGELSADFRQAQS